MGKPIRVIAGNKEYGMELGAREMRRGIRRALKKKKIKQAALKIILVAIAILAFGVILLPMFFHSE